MVRVDFPAYALSMHKQNALRIQRATALTELAPSPFYSNRHVRLVDINVFAKFDGIPSLPIQDIKEKANVVDKELQKAITLIELTPRLIFLLFAKFDEIPPLPVQDIKEKKTKCRGLRRITKGSYSKRLGL